MPVSDGRPDASANDAPGAPVSWPLHLGGFLGPFGASMLNTMLPELAHGLNTSVTTAGSAVRVPKSRIGRSLGTYTSMQAAGQAFAPFVGGPSAGVDHRLRSESSLPWRWAWPWARPARAPLTSG